MAHETDPNIPGQSPATSSPRPPRLGRPPFLMIAVGLVSVVASWVPLVMFARARTVAGAEPRVQFLQDMGTQPRFSVQQSNDLFADGRADRLPVPGTIARGQLEEDDHYFRGYVMDGGAPKFFTDFPDQIQSKLDVSFIRRGQARFEIYCSPCHGLDGHGHGAVNERAVELSRDPNNHTAWTPAADLTSNNVQNRTVGHIYNTINVGIRSMPSYGAQIPVEDRWAIVSYVRALQENATVAPAPAAPGSAALTTPPSGAPSTPPSGAPSTAPSGAPSTAPSAPSATVPSGGPAIAPPGPATTAPSGAATAPGAPATSGPATEPSGGPATAPAAPPAGH